MGKPGDLFRLDLPDAKWMDRELQSLDRKLRKRVYRGALRAAAASLRSALRREVRSSTTRRTGDLIRAVYAQVRTSKRTRALYAIVGFRYRGAGPQDPGVYASFIHGGATREKRGRVAKRPFKITQSDISNAVDAFARGFRQQLHKLKGG